MDQVSATPRILAIDLGKTSCRAALWTSAGVRRDGAADLPGAPGLAASDGVAQAQRAVGTAVDALLVSEVEAPTRLAVGAAGALAAPAARAQLAEQLGARWSQVEQVVVTSDAITAHAGALQGGPGIVLTLGTGAVTLGVSATGELVRADGWGPWLGDVGSGQWIGRQALSAVLASHDGRGPATELTALVTDRFGGLETLPLALEREGQPARVAASVAPSVAAAAVHGDAVAMSILRSAADALAVAVAAVAARMPTGEAGRRIVIRGGATQLGAPLLAPLQAALTDRGSGWQLCESVGDALEGARLLALDASTPHEQSVHRSQAAPR